MRIPGIRVLALASVGDATLHACRKPRDQPVSNVVLGFEESGLISLVEMPTFKVLHGKIDQQKHRESIERYYSWNEAVLKAFWLGEIDKAELLRRVIDNPV